MMVNAYQIKRRVYDRSTACTSTCPPRARARPEHILCTYRADQKFTHEEARLLDLCLLVHADHGGGNCSTFTCRVLSSSGTDTYAAISGGHRRAERPQARRREPEGHAPAGLHSGKCGGSVQRRRGAGVPAQDPPQGARRRQRPDLRHGPRRVHAERPACADFENPRQEPGLQRRATTRSTSCCAASSAWPRRSLPKKSTARRRSAPTWTCSAA